MGDIDSVTGVNLVQLENRQLKILKIKKLKIWSFFLLLGDMAKKKILIFSEYLPNSWFCKILNSQTNYITHFPNKHARFMFCFEREKKAYRLGLGRDQLEHLRVQWSSLRQVRVQLPTSPRQVQDKSESNYQRVQDKSKTIEKHLRDRTRVLQP